MTVSDDAADPRTAPRADLDEDLLQHGVPWHVHLSSWSTSSSSAMTALVNDPGAVERWRLAIDPQRAGLFERRLDWAGIDAAVIGAPRAPSEGSWLGTLDAVRLAVRHETWSDLPGANAIPFIDIIGVIAVWAWGTLDLRDPAADLEPPVIASLQLSLCQRLSEVLAPALGAQFCGAASLADVLRRRISRGSGPPPTQRYRSFCFTQRAEGLEPLLREYPVIGRLLAVCIEQWRAVTEDLLRQLSADRPLIEETFGIDARQRLTGIEPDLSDPHRRGRRVAILHFEDGQRLVYKPKDLRLEAHFHRVLALLEATVPGARIGRLEVLPVDGSHGFVEYVKGGPTDPDGMAEFYRNAGRLLCAIHTLGGTDCHFENLIAAGDHLVLVDPETLFEGQMVSRDEESTTNIDRALRSSVLRTGMLPSWVFIGEQRRPVDMSALGAPPVTTSPGLTDDWCFTNTDDMVWGRREVSASHPLSSPVGPGGDLGLGEHADSLLAGFEEMYRVILEPGIRVQLLDLVRGASGLPRRVVVRSTRVYALVQQEALGPIATRTATARAICLEKLARSHLAAEEPAPSWPLLAAEIEALEQLDVPYFEQLLGDGSVRTGSGLVVEGLLDDDGLEPTCHRIESMSEVDLAWQLDVIRGAVAARVQPLAPTGHTKTQQPAKAPVQVDAAKVASDILSRALTEPNGDLTWLAVSAVADVSRVQLGSISMSLYDGRAGLAAFLFDLGESTAAQATISPLIKAIDADDAAATRFLTEVGPGYLGCGGFLRALGYFGLRDHPGADWERLHQRVISLLNASQCQAKSSDFLSGTAGLLGPLARRAASDRSPSTQRLISAMGSLLCDRQQADGGWPSPGHAQALTGLSHGASGIAVSLAAASVATRDASLLECALAGLEFERRQFDPEAGNWPDHRSSSPTPTFMCSWCHGALGIGLARQQMLDLLPAHPQAGLWQEELSIAAETSARRGIVDIDHLCCGNLGVAAGLHWLGVRQDQPRWRSAAESITQTVLQSSTNRGFTCLLGVNPSSAPLAPGLLTGVSGIGMHLLHGPDGSWLEHLLL